ncbi:RagB/SusD family nutrient uptake outer membrane protein [Formosa sp. S-31]|uniref:RagB/SusD family nutrient uptake outer membrane protein n=1 Tax=Formosa sp. S-31 TaxID=2790949 RepID=UPI003EBD80C7
MKIFKYIAFIAGITCFLSSCRDYVEIEPEGNSRVLKYTSDYRGLANNYMNMGNAGGIHLLGSDDAEFSESYQAQITDIWANAYTWQPTIYNESQGDSDWSNLYLAIYYANVMIDGVMESENGTNAEKEEIIAEAYVHRAFAYLQLVNVYGPQFDGQNTLNEKAVPLLLTPDLYVSLERATVNEVYNQIISDLQSALTYNLSDLPEFNALPSKAAVYALLARTYLYMGNYELALFNAEQVLKLQNTLLSLATYKFNPYGYPPVLQNPEVIFSKKLLNMYRGIAISPELLSSFETEDVRFDVYTASGNNFYPVFEGRAFALNVYSYSNGINVGPSVPEMYLIAAECNVRTGNIETGMEQLNALRKSRFTEGADYVVSASNATDALDFVIAERRKEFVGRGFRWFDQKRLNLEDRYRNTITREFKGNSYSLEPGSAAYVYPVFQNYIDLNPELGN